MRTPPIRPQDGPQTEFMFTKADIAIYGGSAGGGKTFAELIEPLRYLAHPRFNCVIFRRTMEQIRQVGGLWSASQQIYPLFNGRGREQQLEWRFPSGAQIKFDSLQYERDKEQFQGAEICLIQFDELTHFTEGQFFYMLSRNRSTCGVRPYIRATTNPDANSWVRRFLAPWLDKEHAQAAVSGDVRWFVRDGGQIAWVSGPYAGGASANSAPSAMGQGGMGVALSQYGAKSVTFIRASIFDNKILLAKDPGYLANLRSMSVVDRRRLLDGDWDVIEGGNFFRREWFEIVEVAPAEGRRVRFWDLAATEAKPGRDPDWTVGVLMNRALSGVFYIEDVQRVRATPKGVEKLVVQMAWIDGRSVAIRMEQEPGSSGVAVISRFVKLLAGFDFRGVRSTGDKSERAKPYSAQAEAGNMKLLAGAWNNDFLNEHVPFPNAQVHDDQVDAADGAMNELCLGERRGFEVW